ncbi:MAG: hypothetical protein WCE75_16275 [Terracidiphilus sp.]
MKSARISLLLALAALVPLAAWAGPAPGRRGGNTATVSGVYSVTFNLNLASTLPAGATIVCKAQIAPGGQQQFFQSQPAAVPVESAAGVAQVSGATATCAVEIPFSWTVNSSSSGVSLSYEIDAVNATGALPALVRVSGQQGVAESYPAAGGTASLSFNVTF